MKKQLRRSNGYQRYNKSTKRELELKIMAELTINVKKTDSQLSPRALVIREIKMPSCIQIDFEYQKRPAIVLGKAKVVNVFGKWTKKP